MPSPTLPHDTLELYCPDSDYRHSDIRLAKPEWRKCLYCNMRFPETDASGPDDDAITAAAEQAALATRSSSSHAGRAIGRSPAGASSRQAAVSVRRQPTRALTGAPFEPAVLPVGRQLAQTSPAQSATSTNSGLTTHIGPQRRFTLKTASSVAVQQRAESLKGLERDRAALARQPDSGDRHMLVSLHFFFAQYENVAVGRYVTKTFIKIWTSGRTDSALIPIGTSFPNQREMIAWLLKSFWANKRTCDVPPEGWEVCTTVDTGTATRAPSWDGLPWDPERPLSLVDYKDQVHDEEGRDKDRKRSGFVQQTKNAKQKVLGVFLVHEELVGEPEDQPPAIETSQPAVDLRKAHPPAPRHPSAVALHSTNASALGEAPSLELDADEDCVFLHEVSTPGSPLHDRTRGQQLEFVDMTARRSNTPLSTVPSTIARQRAVQLGINPPRTAWSRAAPSSTALPSTALRSTAPSSVDPGGLAQSTTALTGSNVPGASNQEGCREEDVGPGHCTPWSQSPEPWREDYIPDVSDDERERFVRPADLDKRTSNDQGSEHAKEARGAGPVEDAEEGVVMGVAGRKRKRAKPGSVKPNGAPKYPTRRAKQAKTKASTAQADHQAVVATRHSGRIQARGDAPLPPRY